jgi:hypothetical protein
MKIRLGVRSLLVSVLAMAGAISRLCACATTDETVTVGKADFNGSSLGPCTGSQTLVIPAAECPTLCPGSQAQAYCNSGAYTQCSCLSVVSKCDSGCCFTSPVACQDKTAAMTDPSEGFCDAELGYLLCNGRCYSEFSCDLPEGYTVVAPDAAADGAVDGSDGSDSSDDAGDAETPEGSADGGADDGTAVDGGDAAADAGIEGGSEAASEAGADASPDASKDAHGDT